MGTTNVSSIPKCLTGWDALTTPNNGIDRSARSEFLIVPSMLFARPIIPTVRLLVSEAYSTSCSPKMIVDLEPDLT
jgi:hypothetical protein